MRQPKPELLGEIVPLKRFRNWDRQIEGFSQKRIFHEAAWLRFLAKDQGGEAVVLQITDSEGRERALWPGLVVRKGPIRIFGSPLRGWGTVAMGPLFHDAQEGALLAAAESAFARKGIHHWEFVSESLQPPAGEAGSGYRMESSDTHRITLHPEEDSMWKGLQQRCRTSIRKATKNGLLCRIAEDGGFLERLHALVADVFARKKTAPPYDVSRLRRLWDALSPFGKVLGIEVRHGDVTAAAGLFIMDDRQAYAWSQASEARFNSWGPNNLLYWEAMRHFGARGISYLHLPGAPGSSIGRFKASFNPEVLNYPFWILDRGRFLRWGRSAYQSIHTLQSKWRYLSTKREWIGRAKREEEPPE